MLQKASQLVFKEIGTVNAISNIYETPALGFVGADFLNLCMEIFTFYEVNEDKCSECHETCKTCQKDGCTSCIEGFELAG